MNAVSQSSVLLLSCFVFSDQYLHSRAVATSRLRLRKAGGAQKIYLPLSTGAACLDGSPYAFLITPGNTSYWTIQYSAGGDSCVDEADCEERATTFLGSTLIEEEDHSQCECRNFGSYGQGLTDCTCVDMLYCDGGFYSGHRDEPYQTQSGKKLYFRGRANLHATLEILLEKYGLAGATDLMVTGVSSGGLSTLLTLDHVASMMPSSMKVRGLPIAGFTLDINSCCDASTCCGLRDCCYNNVLSKVFDMHNMTGKVSTDCTAKHPDDPSHCLLGIYATHFVKTPMFLLNSKYDAHQLVELLGFAFGDVYKKQRAASDLLDSTQAFGEEFMKQLSVSFETTPHAAYITSCICHGACGLDNSFFGPDNRFQGKWIGQYLGMWLHDSWPEGTTEKAFFIDSAGPNYDCDVNGEVHAVGP